MTAPLRKRLEKAAGSVLNRLREQAREQLDVSRYAAYDAATLARRPFINIGADSFSHKHWTNVDYATEWYGRSQTQGFVHYDLTAIEPLPFESGSQELAYTSHTIEHVGDDAVRNLMAECARVLKPGGGFRITCPDARLIYRTAELGRRDLWAWRRAWYEGPLSLAPSFDSISLPELVVREVATTRSPHYKHAKDPIPVLEILRMFESLDYGEFVAGLSQGVSFDPKYPGDHVSWWDTKKISSMLREAGFSHVYPSGRGQSLFAPLGNAELFDNTMPLMSVYVEAIR